ncbi:AAA family ATPase [Ornithinimicrobium avium]|uniref:AAA+ ATPase domain-containing protein n=1 Tax=Ornithinimicrobium avium TaxID=2283195 RepID=A0A345NKS3_9MICO|nr:AAA family ATPase [Ornithinimicrobium avium]AXH95631.1 hypothetical protein DV701_05415 [Ornithinimicrobium avium]
MRLTRPPEPAVLAKARGPLERELRRAWEDGRTHGPRPDAVLDHPDVVTALLEMTHRTCVYCEKSLEVGGPEPVVVTHHRPRWGAVGTSGDVDPPAYWWLTYAWDNLYPACPDCVRLRGSRFPVAGPRATGPEGLADERPLLLDPLADDPDEHLRYQADGTVAAFTERGRTTHDVLGLNRDSLVRARTELLDQAMKGKADPDVTAFVSARRQLAPSTIRDIAAAPGARRPSSQSSLAAGPTLPPGAGAGPGRAAYDLTATMGEHQRETYFGTTQWVERVVIKNFRPIRDLDIDLSRSTSERGPWQVMLGENGSGKSSVLHAVALTLMGGDQRRALGIDARKYLRHGARTGLVQVYLAGRTDPLEMRWGAGDREFEGPEPVPALLLGYGATRILPRDGGAPEDDRVVRVDNLFDPFVPLTDPTTWLLSLDDETFAEVAEGIHSLLALGSDDELIRTRDTVHLRQGKGRSELPALSDGYQSMVVMSCDILRSVLTMWSQPALAEGIVLIDEVGAHLHPRWRMRVVSAMRDLLPRVQFIISTHDPLCLRGVLDGEVVVIRRNTEGDVVAITDLPSVTGMRIDQLLTSEHFGLGSTDDPEVAELWETYYRIKGATRPTAEQTAELERVTVRLDQLEQLGTTERDRLVLGSAADYIAERRERGDAAPSSDQVRQRLAELWSQHLPGAPV